MAYLTYSSLCTTIFSGANGDGKERMMVAASVLNDF